MNSFAQAGEDIIAIHIFNRIGIGRPSYLDIGAYHPFDLSNTALLYCRGARGINVEANPDLIVAFERHRPGDINLCAAVGPQRGREKFNLKHASLVQFSESECIEVDVMTVMDVVERCAAGVFPDFLNIDAEGMDLDILKSIDYSRGPKVICAEVGTDTSGQYVDVSKQVREHLAPYYSPVFRADNNLFLVRNEYSGRLF